MISSSQLSMNQENLNTPRALVLSGYGINCEEETAYCLNRAGANAQIVHVNTLIENKKILEQTQIFVVPGGFSYGDHIASGRILANKLRYTLHLELSKFIEAGKAVLGICNGFQVLVKSGFLQGGASNELLPNNTSIIANASARYEDRWVNLYVSEGSNNLWLQGIKFLALPVRHGEGRVVFSSAEVRDAFERERLAVLRYGGADGKKAETYPENPNGSELSVAGISSPAGNVLGLMPHPEAFSTMMLSPGYFNSMGGTNNNQLDISRKHLQLDNSDTQLLKLFQAEDGAGMALFYNAVRAMKKLLK